MCFWVGFRLLRFRAKFRDWHAPSPIFGVKTCILNLYLQSLICHMAPHVSKAIINIRLSKRKVAAMTHPWLLLKGIYVCAFSPAPNECNSLSEQSIAPHDPSWPKRGPDAPRIPPIPNLNKLLSCSLSLAAEERRCRPLCP